MDAIIEATRQLVEARGFDCVTTRMIAERAGVGVGSLYQYFPTYEAILFAWYERVSLKAAQEIRLTTMDVMDLSTGNSVRIAIGRLLDIYVRERLVLVEMPMQVGQIEQVIRHTSLEALNRSTIRLFMAQHPEFDFARADAHVFYIDAIMSEVIRRYVLSTSTTLSPDEIVDELTAIILGYLERNRVVKKT
ncbi:helix-turn-helix domain-containing protein [Novosphingobium sp. BL-8H]|uniref:TetR/AcrR family transcriptional regulator n=1 Tax=Novosphingobium sp. BL-8H TaxID=3127640 RepID=UPI0037571B3A